MKKQILFLSAILLLTFSCKNQDDKSQVALDNIMTRTSIRAYQDKPVEQEKVETLLKAAMAAPTSCNKQPWSFCVVNDKDILKSIAQSSPNVKMVGNAPLAIIVCADMKETLEGEGRDFWIQDCSAATENLLLAANAMGLGAVWTGFWPVQERVQTLQNILNMPTEIIPLCVVPIGYPAENPSPKDKWKPVKIHYNKW